MPRRLLRRYLAPPSLAHRPRRGSVFAGASELQHYPPGSYRGGVRAKRLGSWADISMFVPGTQGDPCRAPPWPQSARSEVGCAANATPMANTAAAVKITFRRCISVPSYGLDLTWRGGGDRIQHVCTWRGGGDRIQHVCAWRGGGDRIQHVCTWRGGGN